MITSSEIYWITRATSIWNVVLIFTAILVVLTILTMLAFTEEYNKEKIMEIISNSSKKTLNSDHLFKVFIFLSFLTIIFTFSLVFIPKTPDLVAMKVLPVMLNNEDMQNIGPNAAKVVNVQLKQWLDKNLEGKT